MPSTNNTDSETTMDTEDFPSQTIAQFASRCVELFDKYEARQDISLYPDALEVQRALFKYWMSENGVLGPPDNSLDYKLRHSPSVTTDILYEPLKVIAESLEELEKPLQNESPEEFKDQSEKNFWLIDHCIRGSVKRLRHTSQKLVHDAKADRNLRVKNYQTSKNESEAIAKLERESQAYILDRFPRISTALNPVLVEANALRLRRLFFERAHQQNLHARAQHSGMVQIGPRAPETPHVLLDESRDTTPHSRDGCLILSVPTKGECAYCSFPLDFRGQSATADWHGHVARDLEPFVCLFAHNEPNENDPTPISFATPKEWVEHMMNKHSRPIWECRALGHDDLIIFHQKSAYEDHVRTEHAPVEEQQVETLSRAALRSIVDKIQDCPFGDEFPASKDDTAIDDPVFKTRNLRHHVAEHMEGIALLVLPKLMKETEDDICNDPYASTSQPTLQKTDEAEMELALSRLNLKRKEASTDERFSDAENGKRMKL